MILFKSMIFWTCFITVWPNNRTFQANNHWQKTMVNDVWFWVNSFTFQPSQYRRVQGHGTVMSSPLASLQPLARFDLWTVLKYLLDEGVQLELNRLMFQTGQVHASSCCMSPVLGNGSMGIGYKTVRVWATHRKYSDNTKQLTRTPRMLGRLLMDIVYTAAK